MFDIIIGTFKNGNISSAISSTFLIILLGFYLRRRGTFDENTGKVLSSVALTVALPALAYSAFMQDIDRQQLAQSFTALIWGIVIYPLLMVISWVFYRRYKGDKNISLNIMTIFGSTTFFGTPIVQAVFGPIGVVYANIFNIGYRLFLYSYGYIKMSGLKMKKGMFKQMFLNPTVVATVLGLLVWIFQESLPQVSAHGSELTDYMTVAFLRFDITAPWIHRPMKYLAGLASPLAWLSIGATLGEVSLSVAAVDRDSWYYSFVKLLAIPVIIIFIMAITNLLGWTNFSYLLVAITVIMLATPPAAVAAAYAIGFDREPVMSSNASLISTAAAVLMIPIWLTILRGIEMTGIFL